MPIPPERVRPAVFATAERFGVTHASMHSYVEGMRAASGGLETGTSLRVVDPAYAVMHRIVTTGGRWLEAADARNMSPAVVVDESMLTKLGLAGRSLPVTVELGQGTLVTATIVGTVPKAPYSEQPQAFMLADTYEQWFGADQPLMDSQYEMWVPVPGSEELAAEVGRAMRAELPGYMVDAQRQDYLAWGSEDPLREVALVVSAIAGVILLLGALSLLNVALVTIQQRVREVGIRRSFGATTGRVFFSVMMESVVATLVAGAIGVMLAIAGIKNPWVADKLLEGLDDVPPFPVEAALIGLAVSIGVGALAGVLPALVAARVKIIDAIRF
jgi:putative ABC transport system permease protein